MFYFREIAFTKTKQRGTIHFTVAPYIIVYIRFEGFIILIIPILIRAITTQRHYFMRIPVLFFFWNKAASFQYQYFLSCCCQFISHRTAAAPGADDDNIKMVSHLLFRIWYM